VLGFHAIQTQSKIFRAHITFLKRTWHVRSFVETQPGVLMPIPCPVCRSTRTEILNRATRVGGTAGAVAGAAGGVAMTLAGAETGAAVGMLAGPIGAAFGGLAGAIIGGLVGGASGCAAGSALGEVVDTHVLDNQRCLDCGHTFSDR